MCIRDSGYTPEQLDSMVRKQDWTFLLSDRIKRSAMSLTDRERSEKYTDVYKRQQVKKATQQ